MINLIVQTKLTPPQIKGKILLRERLLNLLKENLNKKLILICADAGYGKTTLLAQFCAGFDKPYVFYDLEASDNDVATFFNYIITGIQQHYPAFGQRTKAIVFQTRNIEILVGTFINEFVEYFPYKGNEKLGVAPAGSFYGAKAPTPEKQQTVEKVKGGFYIILDDYHHIQQNREIGNALDYLLRHLPLGLHLIVSSRSTPQLNLACYLAKQELFRLEKEQLQFNIKEIQALLKEVYGFKIPDEEMQRVEKHSEGWITAIQLIVQKIATSGEEKAKETLNGYVASGEEVFNYFAHEVFENEPKKVQDFLMKTSILEYINTEICQEVLRIKNAKELFKYLLEEHLFVIPADGNFRYHSLFRNFLIERLKDNFGNDEIKRLYEKVGSFFKINHDPFQAVNYLLIGRSFKKAARIIEQRASELISKGQINQLFEWLNQIPSDLLQKRPWLLVRKAEGNISVGRWDEALDILTIAERMFRISGRKNGRAEVLYHKGVVLFRLGKLKESFKVLAKANNFLGSTNYLLRAKILHTMGWIKSNDGDYTKAKSYFEEGISQCRKIRDKALEAQLTSALAVVEYRQSNFNKALEYYEFLINRFKNEIIFPSNLANIYGNAASMYIEQEEYEKAEDLIKKAEDIANKYNDRRSLLYLSGVRGKFYLKQCHFDKAIDYFEKVLDLNQKFGEDRINVFAYLDLSSIFKEKGNYAKSEKYLNRAGEIVKEKKGIDYLQYLYLKAELKSIFGDLTSAERICKNVIALAIKIKAYRYIFKGYFFLVKKSIEEDKKKQAISYLSKAITLSKKHNADEFFTQELENDTYLLKFIINEGMITGYLGNILHNVRSPEAKEILAELGLENSTKKGICDYRIYLFGGLRLEDSTGRIIEPHWLTKKTKSLFAFLVVNRKIKNQRDLIIEQFWPDVNIREGRHNLQMSISFLRKLLHETSYRRIEYKNNILYKDGCYFLNHSFIFIVDAEEFENLLHKGALLEAKNEEKGFEFYTRAIDIYKGDYGIDMYDLWCEEKRVYYRELCCKILKKLAEFQFLNKNYEESLNLYQRALNFNKFDETTYCGLMQNFAHLGNLKAITEQYNYLKKILKEELNASPSTETQNIFQSLLSRTLKIN